MAQLRDFATNFYLLIFGKNAKKWQIAMPILGQY
jgi:hypothetical protein